MTNKEANGKEELETKNEKFDQPSNTTPSENKIEFGFVEMHL